MSYTEMALRHRNVAKLRECAAELRASKDPLASNSGKKRSKLILDALREAHCSIETPSGIRISPALKALIEKQVAELRETAAEDATGKHAA
jgi:hypothetical protein